jgi:hypothetical protein
MPIDETSPLDGEYPLAIIVTLEEAYGVEKHRR